MRWHPAAPWIGEGEEAWLQLTGSSKGFTAGMRSSSTRSGSNGLRQWSTAALQRVGYSSCSRSWPQLSWLADDAMQRGWGCQFMQAVHQT